jgi:hypothetical protein
MLLLLLFPLSPRPSGTQLENLMETMRAEIAAQPPVEGSYAARRGDYCIANFSADGEWYVFCLSVTWCCNVSILMCSKIPDPMLRSC